MRHRARNPGRLRGVGTRGVVPRKVRLYRAPLRALLHSWTMLSSFTPPHAGGNRTEASLPQCGASPVGCTAHTWSVYPVTDSSGQGYEGDCLTDAPSDFLLVDSFILPFLPCFLLLNMLLFSLVLLLSITVVKG